MWMDILAQGNNAQGLESMWKLLKTAKLTVSCIIYNIVQVAHDAIYASSNFSP